MRSLFPRIFVSFWIAMTLIGAAFAFIYATSYPSERFERRRNLVSDAIRLHAQEAVAAATSDGDPVGVLSRFRERTELSVSLLRDDGQIYAEVPPSHEERRLADEVRRSGHSAVREVPDAVLMAMRLSEPPPADDASEGTEGARRYTAVARIPRASAWARAVGADTLPSRLLVVFLVSGLVSFLLARYLTRPFRSLRRATQRIAEGDLSARVGPELGSADAEIAALGRDFDRMAGRVEDLILAQQRLLSDVSHELNSPLARLRVALELARQRTGDAATGPLDRIEREAERLSALVGEILTLTRLENDPSPALSEVDLRALVDEVARDADFEARGLGRRVVVRRTEPTSLLGEEEILRRAVENIVRNAVRFAPEGTDVVVEMATRDGAVELSVRDHGPGVPEDALREIFVPLYRVAPDRDRKTGGAGLGLAIAERAVKLHHGTIEARNVAEGGLLVTVSLPLTAA